MRPCRMDSPPLVGPDGDRTGGPALSLRPSYPEPTDRKHGVYAARGWSGSRVVVPARRGRGGAPPRARRRRLGRRGRRVGGDPALRTLFRSSAKPIQALPVVRARPDLDDAEIAIACASHLHRPGPARAGAQPAGRGRTRPRTTSSAARSRRGSSTTAPASMRRCCCSAACTAGRARAIGSRRTRASRRCWPRSRPRRRSMPESDADRRSTGAAS